MAATNRAETQDPALFRPGRFDRQVLVYRLKSKGIPCQDLSFTKRFGGGKLP
jgi:hypothetical protein